MGYRFTYNTLGSILTACAAGSPVATYTYSADTAQNILRSYFGNGQVISYEYEGNGGISAIKLGEDTQFDFVYFNEQNTEGQTTKEWTELTDYVNNIKKVFEESKLTVKNLNNNLVYSVENVSEEDNSDYDFNGRVEISAGHNYATKYENNTDRYFADSLLLTDKTFKYDENGKLEKTKILFLTTNYGYSRDSDLVTTYSNSGTGDIRTEDYNYIYDQTGKITDITLASDYFFGSSHIIKPSENTHYNYDRKGQLVSSENNTKKTVYTYDSRGNITSKKKYTVSVDIEGDKVYTETASNIYSYDSVWEDKLSSFNGQNISYDESGNPISYLGHNLSWSMARQLANYDNIAYTYDENGMRTSKTVGNNTTKYYYDGTRLIEQTDGTSPMHFIYDRNDEILGLYYRGEEYFFVKNLQGDITGILDDMGMLIVRYSYDDWGHCTVTSIDEDISNLAELNPIRYRGYYYDNDTGLYYLQSRYYDPETGRFINCDDVNYIGLTESGISCNPFAYCENDPVNCVDPEGNDKNNISFFASELAMIYVSYSVKRNRDGTKYNVILGNNKPFYKNVWVDKYTYERTEFYKLLKIKYEKNIFPFKVTKKEYDIKKYIQDLILNLSLTYLTRGLHWVVGCLLGTSISKLSDKYLHIIKKPGEYRTISISAIIDVPATDSKECLLTIYTVKKNKSNNKWELYSSIVTGVLY